MAAEEIGIEADKMTESALVEDQLNELSQAYAEYMNVDLTNEKSQVNESTDELLTKLEEFLAVVDLARSDNIQCLEQTLPKIVAKYEQLQPVFTSIDKLEMLVNVVKDRVNTLSVMVSESEKRLLPESSITKLFTPLFARKDSSKDSAAKSQDSQTSFQAPVIFKAKDYVSTSTSENSL